MRVEVSMTANKDEFTVSSWWATSPELVVSSLRSQLEAAQAVWPELRQYSVTEKRRASITAPQATGGIARAASLTPERRSEVARKAAEARWAEKVDTDLEKAWSKPAT